MNVIIYIWNNKTLINISVSASRSTKFACSKKILSHWSRLDSTSTRYNKVKLKIGFYMQASCTQNQVSPMDDRFFQDFLIWLPLKVSANNEVAHVKESIKPAFEMGTSYLKRKTTKCANKIQNA